MKIEQIYTGCLSHGAYYIESKNQVAIVDPLREVKPYIEMAKNNNSEIKYVLETHFHADFVSGHKDLAEKTGATIIFGPTNVSTGYEYYSARDGEKIKLGNIYIKVLHTPGHTLESSCYLIIDENGKETALFTGDTLFIGDVGRPDLAQSMNPKYTKDTLARLMFNSLRTKIEPLSDDILIYPAHGAGSACGKNMSTETYDTLGNQKRTNYALNTNLTEDEFVKELLDGLMPPPGYFPKNVLMNIKGYDKIDKVIQDGMKELSISKFEAIANETNALVLDTRDANDFLQGFIPDSIFIGLNGSFAPWVGRLIPDINQKILLICEPGREEEAIIRLARVGYNHTIGYLKGGFKTWKNEGRKTETIINLDASELFDALNENKGKLLDVRKINEYRSEHVIDAINTPLDLINENMNQINPNQNYFVHCQAGYRSVIFISILKSRGYKNLINVKNGFKGIKQSNLFHLSNYLCPTTML